MLDYDSLFVTIFFLVVFVKNVMVFHIHKYVVHFGIMILLVEYLCYFSRDIWCQDHLAKNEISFLVVTCGLCMTL